MKYYYAVYNEDMYGFMTVHYSNSLNTARKNLVREISRYNDGMGAVSTDPTLFRKEYVKMTEFLGIVYVIAHPDPHRPYLYRWKAKGHPKTQEINKDGSLRND